MMSVMDIDRVLSEHNYAKKYSFDTIYHVDELPERAVNTYQESKIMFQGEMEKGKFISLLTPSESMCCVLDIEDNSELATQSQSGEESPAFEGVIARRPQLESVREGDIRLHVAQKYQIDVSAVNNVITNAFAGAKKRKKSEIEQDDNH
ncbi:hypothetical protein HHI36_015931 [Cryptolaemus montrouzieri]|uniref:Uncharacterized protein n=1 Tax=Cryptolaemus montrouzieri TaxID=559131 RepID=A0ABD2N876_9CUCU